MGWVQGSAVALPFLSRKFDVAICQQGLQFFPDRARAFQDIARILAPAGRLALSVWRSIKLNPATAVLAEGLERYVGQEAANNAYRAFSLGGAGELEDLLKAAGFHEIEIRAVTKTVRY